MTENQTMRVFLYGSLMTGEPNNRVLTNSDGRAGLWADLAGGPEARLVGSAATAPLFTLRDLGPFPCLEAGGSTAVSGEVWEVNAPMLARLDRLEGHPHFYQRTPIPLADGSHAEAYLMTRDEFPAIEGGCWKTYVAARDSWRRGVM